MPIRVITLLLSFALLWSGLNTIETPFVLAQLSSEHGQAEKRQGSVEHHHLDDLPAQLLSDPANETPGLLPPAAAVTARSLVVARAPAFTASEAGPPFLAGPLRPPCSAARAG